MKRTAIMLLLMLTFVMVFTACYTQPVEHQGTPMAKSSEVPEFDASAVKYADDEVIDGLLEAIADSPDCNAEVKPHIAQNRAHFQCIVDMGFGALPHLCDILEDDSAHYQDYALYTAVAILQNVYTTQASAERLALLERTDKAIAEMEVRRGYKPYYTRAMGKGGGTLLAVWRDASITGSDDLHYSLTGIWNKGVRLSSIYQGILTSTNLEYMDYLLAKMPEADVFISQVDSKDVTEADLQATADALSHERLHVDNGWYERLINTEGAMGVMEGKLSAVDEIELFSIGNGLMIIEPAVIYNYLLYLDALRLIEHEDQEEIQGCADFTIMLKSEGEAFLWVEAYGDDVVCIDHVKYHVKSKDVWHNIHRMVNDAFKAQCDKVFTELLEDTMKGQVMPTRCDGWYSYFPTIQEKIAMWKDIEAGMANYAYQEYELTDDDIKELHAILADCDIAYAESRGESNTDFHIGLSYEDVELFFNACSDGTVYVSYMREDGESRVRVYGVVDSKELFEFITRKAGSPSAFSFDYMKDVDGITIQYIADHQKKDFDEDLEYTKVKIEDKETITRIVDTLKEYSAPVGTYPCREDSDLILHQDGEDIYLKLKYDGGYQDFNKDEYPFSEPTIIVNGYYWFENLKLYKLLNELAKGE